MQLRGVFRQARQRRIGQYAALAAGVIVIFIVGVLVGDGRLRVNAPSQFKSETGLSKTLDYAALNQVYDSLRQNYDGKLTQTQILNGLKHGLAEATGDPYTVYFTPQEAKAFNGELQGQSLTGVGAELDQDQNGNIIVMAPLDGSPAQAAGVRAKDIIATINGKSTAGMSLNDAVANIRGKAGTKVTLGIVRGNQQLTLTITRAQITVPTASSKILPGNIGYLQVSQFSDSTFGLVEQAVTKFQQNGVKKIVLDLRDNPGGEVTSAQDIASLWLPDGAIVEQEKRGQTVVDSYRATGDNPLKGIPTVVLINNGSASAAEITTLALRDNKAAYIMGEKSYGKGVVQQVIPFSDGSELKVTIAKWYAPDGENINHKGITPTQTVNLTDADAAAGTDTQLQAAEAYLAAH